MSTRISHSWPRRPLAGLIAAAALAGVTLGSASAQQTAQIGSFGDWSAFRDTSGPTPVCYVGSAPKRSTGAVSQRASTYIQVIHRPAAKSFDVVSVKAGYDYQPGSQVEVDIDGKEYVLFTNGDRAWAKDGERDAELVAAMRRGRQMIVRGTSSRGVSTTDTYSLSGFTAARNAIESACPRK